MPSKQTHPTNDPEQDSVFCLSTDSEIEGVTINSVHYDNGRVVVTGTLFDITYKYVFKPTHNGHVLDSFEVNQQRYSQSRVGSTGLPGERAIAERAFYAARAHHSLQLDASNHKTNRELATMDTIDFTAPTEARGDGPISLTFDGIDDRSETSLTVGQVLYDYHEETFYTVAMIHTRSNGAITRSVELRNMDTGRINTPNMTHLDVKLDRERILPVEGRPVVEQAAIHSTDAGDVAVGDRVTIEGQPRTVTSIQTLGGREARAVVELRSDVLPTSGLRVRTVKVADLLQEQ